jgi:predicted Zn-dependent protease
MWYEMLTGRHPFENVGLEAKANADETGYIRAHQAARKWPIRPARANDDPHKPEHLEPVSECNQEFKEHPQLEAMLAGCLAYEQSKRYPNAAVLLAHVEKYIKDGFVDMVDLAPVMQAPEVEATETVKKSVEACLRDAETILAQGNGQGGLTTVEGVLQRQPGLLAGVLLKARCLARLKRIEEAKQVWAEARKQAPRDPAVYEVQAEIHEAEGKKGLADSARQNANRFRHEASGAPGRRF